MAIEREGDDSYEQLLELEELESLQEEIEETGLAPEGDWERLPPDLLDRLAAFGITNASELVTRIASMHAELDEL